MLFPKHSVDFVSTFSLLTNLFAWIFLYLFRPSYPILSRAFPETKTLGLLILSSVVVVFLTSVRSTELCSHSQNHFNLHSRSMEKKVHRKWNDEEDRELIYALHDLVNKGDKRDNGFKAGSLTVIEEVLHEKLPGHGIKAKPHIESRIKTLKKDVCIVYDMIYGGSTSGFGWDPNTNMVVAEKHIWDGYVKSHKDAANWRNRSFPHFEMLLTVFGKDRATGKNAVTAEDVLEEESRNEGSCDTENLGIGIEEMEHFLSSTNGEESNSNGKKRKRNDDSLDAFREAATIIGSKIEEATNKFSQALGVDLAIAKMRDKVNDELRKLSNLSMIQRHRALLAIARDHAMFLYFER
ncbi:hypothetical protein RHSIM_Rhsim05G0015700 [Rhododendron simsii]|uniref:Myb/SANT-like domain-containing protein n=1 Tax=Rhododendron simsii TaxID=118357 RepID=A0A834GY53_RHOSS|nr:hypothetical protein RHSIM_Rhsim05G0015700 [Rhododendron simsii]